MNQNPEQLARDTIDAMLTASGWVIQNKNQINLSAGVGVAIREYQTDVGPADYVLFVNKKPVGVIEAKREDEAIHLTVHEDQTEGYAKAKLRLIDNDPLVFARESTSEVTALQIFYGQPYRRRELSYKMIKDLVETIKTNKPLLAPLHVWQAYEQLEKVNGSTKNELIALVSLVRKVSGIDNTPTPFDKTVDKNFQEWIFKKQAGTLKYTEEQVQWLRMIKDYIANSFHVDRDDFELDPFNKQGGSGKMWQLFGETNGIIDLNERLAA